MPGKIKIDKKIPIPPMYHFPSKYPLAKMKVGDSFFVKLKIGSIGGTIASWKKNNKSKFKFTTRANKTGTRVWRVQ